MHSKPFYHGATRVRAAADDEREAAVRREIARLRLDPDARAWGGLRSEAELLVDGREA